MRPVGTNASQKRLKALGDWLFPEMARGGSSLWRMRLRGDRQFSRRRIPNSRHDLL